MSQPDRPGLPLHGLLAEFDTPEALLAAARRVADDGYRRVDAYTPYPVDGLAEAIGFRRNGVAPIVLACGILGGTGAYFMEWYANVISYPINVGGRPDHSWPSFVPITFELTVLAAALSAAFSMLILNGLPRLHHPIFNGQGIERATTEGFFLCIAADDPHFELGRTTAFLETLGARAVTEVPE